MKLIKFQMITLVGILLIGCVMSIKSEYSNKLLTENLFSNKNTNTNAVGMKNTNTAGATSTVGAKSTAKVGATSTVGAKSTAKVGATSTVGAKSTAKVGATSTVGSKSTAKVGATSTVGAKSTAKVGAKSTAKVGAKSTVKIGAKSTIKFGAKSKNTVGAKNTNKRTATDFFNDLFTSKELENELFTGEEGKNSTTTETKETNEPKVGDLFQEIENLSTDSNSSNSTMLSDWLMISSRMFRNKQRFPPVALHSGEKVEIKVDQFNFRLNEGFIENSKDSNIPPERKYFWFRLSGSNLYYSSTISDINILGAVSVRFITKVSHVDLSSGNSGNKEACKVNHGKGNEQACFIVKDFEDQDWKLCAETEEIRLKWVCRIQKVIGAPLDEACGGEKIEEIPYKTVIQPIIVIPIPSRHCNDDWNYNKLGKDWECDCSEGREQSPINLPIKEKAIDSPIKPMFQYEEIEVRSSVTTLEGQMKEHEVLKLRYDMNVLKVIHHNMGKVVTIDGAVYHAQEILIHTPAEHTIDGKKFDLEVQIVHYGQTVGDIAKQVVLCFLFEKKAGVYNKFLDDLDIFNLPNPISKTIDLNNNIFIPKILYSTEDNDAPVMRPFSFYTYQGSLSFPPCSERTIVYVSSKPLSIGTTAIQLFQEALRIPDMINKKGDVIVSNWIPASSRETQAVNGRPIFHYDHEKYCGPDPIKKIAQPRGHYEKVMKSAISYFYVNDMTPSGLPGAFVVSEKEALGK